MEKEMKKTHVVYKATGYVYGKLWGGGEGAYPAETINSASYDDLCTQIKDGIESGGLDSGMGYQNLIGAVMYIDTITDMEIEGKIFSNVDTTQELFGDLTQDQENFLYNLY